MLAEYFKRLFAVIWGEQTSTEYLMALQLAKMQSRLFELEYRLKEYEDAES